jgi:predicted phage tail protein
VAAINSIGFSSYSALSNAATPIRVVGKKESTRKVQSASVAAPGIPRNVKATTAAKKRLSATWRYAKQDLGTNVNFIVIIRGKDGVAARLTVSDLQGVTIAGLAPGDYRVRVRAFNSLGFARASKPASIRLR